MHAMIGGTEIVAGSVVIFWVKKRYFGSGATKYCGKTQPITETSDTGSVSTSEHVRERLLALAAEHKEKEEQGLINDKEGQLDEEEIFGSGVWGVDFVNLKYKDEIIKSVSLYEETIKPRPILSIVHPYILVETDTWMYVLEKWRDGVAISRFKRKDDAVRSRGKWFGPGRLSQRKAPHLVQSTTEVQYTTTDLLVWAMEHPDFKQYTDNCHTFAHNCSKKVGMKNPNSLWEDYLYESY
uniref:PPPDE domain-containing protein n=1 Tax=Eutreptiella gymnastica TaxID=73025 RepID=A0A7S4FVU0_9EUGL